MLTVNQIQSLSTATHRQNCAHLKQIAIPSAREIINAHQVMPQIFAILGDALPNLSVFVTSLSASITIPNIRLVLIKMI